MSVRFGKLQHAYNGNDLVERENDDVGERKRITIEISLGRQQGIESSAFMEIWPLTRAQRVRLQ